MLPVACLPAAAVLLGLGYWIQGLGVTNVIPPFLIAAGSAIIDNLPYLFAIGVAIGMAKKSDGAAALSGLVAFLVATTLLGPDSVAKLKGIDVADVDLAFSAIKNVFVGMISGLVAAYSYNKFAETQLPQALAFFSGKRCVPIITSVFMLFVSIILFFIWPIVYQGLVSFGMTIKDLGPVGAGLYAFANRLLIPTGLHHALNQVFWQNLAGINDIGNFLHPTQELIDAGGIVGNYRVGMYQAGFFPVMMFGLPAAALAMYHTAKDHKKKVVYGLLMAGAFSSFFTGVSEPLEFSFMFLAPGLYLIHAILTGLSVAFAAAMGWMSGFAFSAGFVDYFLTFRLPLASQPYMLLLQGLVAAVIYYTIFRFAITKFRLKTPGREDDDATETEDTKPASSGNNFTNMASIILEGLGGIENIASIDNCVTRLRLEIKNLEIVDDKKIKSAGVAGVIRPGKNSVQVIVGTQVQFVSDELKKLCFME